jgi:ArsR family transcriptional regulator
MSRGYPGRASNSCHQVFVTKLTFIPFQITINYIQRFEYLNAGSLQGCTMIRRKTSYEIQAELFGALAHPARLEILDLLRAGEACVCHIQAMLDQRQAYISQHLNVLRRAGLVAKRKEGLRVYYQVTDLCVLDLIDSMRAVLHSMGIWPAIAEPALLGTVPPKACNCPQCQETRAR